MGYAVRMPQLGMTMEEGVVVEWRFEEGESFEEGDVIAVVESEKTQNDVAARKDGQFLELFVDLEESVGPGDPIAYVGDTDESIPQDIREETENDGAGGTEPTTEEGNEESPAGNEAATVQTASDADSGEGSTSKVSPRARTYARETEGVQEADLGKLSGSGPEDAVVEADVAEAVEAGIEIGAKRTGTTGAGGQPTRNGQKASTVDVDGRDIYEQRDASRLRQAVADRMAQSAREAPQVTLNRSVPVSALLDLKDQLAEDRDLDLSLSDFLLAAVADALEQYPEFNAVYRNGIHELAGNINVGLAVDAENGLLTPVVKGANRRSLTDLAAERSRVVRRVLEDEHTHDDISAGTFTITNLGHFGVDSFDPIVNPPQVAILGVGALREEYDPETGDSRSELTLSLTFDHRPVDGADGARFLDAIAESLTHPLTLLTLAEDARGAATSGASGAKGTFHELEEPQTGERSARATSSEGMHATVQSRQFEWDVDEPEEVGGDDTAPNPVEQFLGSLAACLSLMVRNMADRRDVPVESVDVQVDASPEHGAVEAIDVQVTIVSSADPAEVKAVVETAERACFVNRAIDEDVERTLSVTVE